jgi:hypothetical protein
MQSLRCLLLVVLLILVDRRSSAFTGEATGLDATMIIDSARSDSVIRLSARELGLGALHLAATYAAVAGSFALIIPLNSMDTLYLDKGAMGAGFLIMITGAVGLGVSHLIGDVIYDANGRLSGSIVGGLTGMFTSLAIGQGWDASTSNLTKFTTMTVPPALGMFLGYWLTSKYDPFGLGLAPRAKKRGSSWELGFGISKRM